MTGPYVRALLALLAAALLAAAPTASAATAQFSGRRLHQATAVATSRAEAAPGGTAESNVKSTAISTGGQPATAVGQGASVAAAGQTVRSECDVYAKDTEQYKVCIGTPEGQKTNISANATAAAARGVVSWEAAPTCSANVSSNSVDSLGRLWGFENGVSCALRNADGTAVYAPGRGRTSSGGAGTTKSVSDGGVGGKRRSAI